MKQKVRQGLGVKTHSAFVEPGDVFVALPGTRHDGTMYIDQALERGAGCIVASNVNRWAHDVSAEFLVHPSPRQGVGELAAAFFGTEKLALKVVGITGTNGKTTTSYMAEHLLSAAGKRVGVIGTVDVHWPGHHQEIGMTTPDCWTVHGLLARMMDEGIDVVCMEVSSHALDQDRVAGISFDVAVFTNLTQDHLDYHRDMESYFQAKARLFQPTDTAVPYGIINSDDTYGRRLMEKGSYHMGYGLGKNLPADQLAGRIERSTRKGIELSVSLKERSWSISSPLVGRHNGMNLLAAQGIGLALGLSVKDMQGLKDFQGVPGRLERVPNGQGMDIFVDYAHTPDALEKVCSALQAVGGKRLLVLFGCGGDRDASKRPLMGTAVARVADVAIVTSDNPRHENPGAIIEDILPGMQGYPVEIIQEPDRRKGIATAIDRMESGDVLLIAGKGHETYQQVGDRKLPFADARIVREYFNENP
ncbi:UDP-N-acetylmuramoyl-L-alanyl-D-glutamate--2,6-diaminopimelate ligase [Desulfoplanes sp.]